MVVHSPLGFELEKRKNILMFGLLNIFLVSLAHIYITGPSHARTWNRIGEIYPIPKPICIIYYVHLGLYS